MGNLTAISRFWCITLTFWSFLLTTVAAQAEGAYHCPTNPPPPVFVGDQSGNPAYCPQISSPAYPFGAGPKVLFDEAHNNWGKISPSPLAPTAGTYFALGELLKADGYQLHINRRRLTAEILQDYDMLVIVAPLPGEYFLLSDEPNKVIPNPIAYSGVQALDHEEVTAIRNWVSAGGSLLLNSEHVPFLNSVQNLLGAFQLKTAANVYDIMSSQPLKIAAPLSPLFQGRTPSEMVRSLPLVPGIGGGVNLIGGGTALTRFDLLSLGFTQTLSAGFALMQYNAFCRGVGPDVDTSGCEELLLASTEGTILFAGAGASPMKALTVGSGRVVVFTEFSTLTSLFDRSSLNGLPYGGLTDKSYTQFILNSLHWLSRLI